VSNELVDSLVGWLRAQLDEDEQVARAAGRDRWVAVDLAFVDDSNGRQVLCDENIASGVRAHIALNDPARVLREVEAKRKIVAECGWTANVATSTSAVAGLGGVCASAARHAVRRPAGVPGRVATMSGVDLVTFLRARLDEREAAAKAAFPGPWRYNPDKQWHLPDDYPSRRNGEEFVAAGPLDAATCVAATGPADHPQSMADATFIVLNDPQFVLADVAAKRRIVDAHADPKHYCAPGPIDRAGHTWYEAGEKRWADIPCLHLRLLAAPYASHPDCRPEWRQA
jgi:hypothetical protein